MPSVLLTGLIRFIDIAIARFRVAGSIVFDIALPCNLIYSYAFFCIQLAEKSSQRDVFLRLWYLSSEVQLKIISNRSALMVNRRIVSGFGMAKNVLHVGSRFSASASISVDVGFRLKLLQGNGASFLEALDQVSTLAFDRGLTKVVFFYFRELGGVPT